MAQFNTPLVVSQLTADLWRVEAPLVYESDVLARTVEVPVGFITDFASVPRLPLAYSFAGNRAHRAAVVHDYLYSTGEDRKKADETFLEAMQETGISRILRRAMFSAVRLFGGSHYERKSLKGAE